MRGVLAATALAALSGTVSAHHRSLHRDDAKRDLRPQPGQTHIGYAEPGDADRAPPAPQATADIVTVPTPIAYTFPTPGIYTIPAQSATCTDATTVYGEASVKLPPGQHTVGGCTTAVGSATVVTVSVATSGTILPATYSCPGAGNYIINPIVTTVTKPTMVVYPTPTTYPPGTYTAPEQVVTVTEANHVTECPFTKAGSSAPRPSEAPADTAIDAVRGENSGGKAAAPEVSRLRRRGGLVSDNDHLGITYTPYDPSNGNCKSAWQVDHDIMQFKAAGFSVVRVYSTDCNTLDSVGSACEQHGMKMIIGVFIGAGGECSYNSPSIRTQVDLIAAWAKWGLVELVVVGNESIANGFCSAAQLRDLVAAVKGKCPGYRGPYTTSETLNVWQRGDVSGALCGVVDMAGANIHAYFNPTVLPAYAGEFVRGQMELLGRICPGKPSINLECGWPTDGHCNGVACPGRREQRQAIEAIRTTVGSRTVFFSYEDDHWKSVGSCGCEKSWGSKALFGL